MAVLCRFAAMTCGILLASPAYADGCMFVPPEEFAALDWGKAERFDQGNALLLMMGMMGVEDVGLVPAEGTTTLWALVVKDKVYIIRQVGPTKLCADDPMDKSVFETGKLRALPRSG